MKSAWTGPPANPHRQLAALGDRDCLDPAEFLAAVLCNVFSYRFGFHVLRFSFLVFLTY
jgi:hypothetical protein